MNPRGAQGSRNVMPVELACGCTLHFGATHMPNAGDSVWCKFCDRATTVVTALDDHKIKCQNCSHARAFGAAPITAETAAVKHALKYGHVVKILKGGKTINTVGNSGGQLSLDDLDR